ncbi:MAG: sugar-binding protein [Kiritimatiellia bacterium]|nr:sugar-binding protein [Kiritimatiellia bacterium]
MKKRTLTLAIILAAVTAQAYVAIVNKSDHTQIHVVPPPGAVTIDGKLDDWDMSGANLMFMDAADMDTYSVHGAMMYDKDYLYIGAHVKDPTPMLNMHAFGGAGNMAWNADAIHVFLVANPKVRSKVSTQGGPKMPPDQQKYVNMLTLWYSTEDKQAGYYCNYTLGWHDNVLNPPGVEGAFRKDADGKGYSMEYRIPWKALRADEPLKGGDAIQASWQMHWGNDQGTAVRCGMGDVRDPDGMDLGYMGPKSWGMAIFEKAGNLKRVERNVLGRAEGHVPIAFELQKPGKVSIAIRNTDDKLIRTCLGAEPYDAGKHTYLWDGLDDYDKPAPVGPYTAHLLTHDGIGMKYLCNIGTSGTPPYHNADGTGGWAGDYNEPTFAAVDGDAVILGTCNAEAAPPLIRTDLNGRKQYGAMTPASFAVALKKGYGYLLSRGRGTVTKFDLANRRLSPFTSGLPSATITTRREGESGRDWWARAWQIHGITVLDDTLIVSSRIENKLYLLDLASGKARGETAVPSPYGLATDSEGTLYAVSENALGTYDIDKQLFKPIISDLDNPRHLACDAAGNIYVSLQGDTMQVWRISPKGNVLIKYGKAGGRPLLGSFDPDGMLKPYGIGVDKNGRLWVAEADNRPKRYSAWNPDGSLWKEFFGSISYSARATVDLEGPEHVYLESVRYLVDYEKGTWKVDATVLRQREENGIMLAEMALHPGGILANHKGRKFLWTLRTNHGPTLYESVNDRFVPRFSMDSRGKKQWWLDDNNDGKVQTEEIRKGLPMREYFWGMTMDHQLNFYWHTGEQWHNQGAKKTTKSFSIVRWNFLGFDKEDGSLTYADPANPQLIATDPDGGAVDRPAPTKDGGVVTLVSGGTLPRGVRPQGSGHRMVKFADDGKKVWEYHNVHMAFAWTSDNYTPGYMVGSVTAIPENTDGIVAVCGYYGQYFLLDSKEGLFIDALGQDQRSAYTHDHTMVLTENFNGAIFKHSGNGKTYFMGGDADLRLWELTGLDTIQRKTVKTRIKPADLAKAEAAARHNVLAVHSARGKRVATLTRLENAAADGSAEEWQTVQPLTICLRGKRTAQAQLGYDDHNLYARFQVGDESPFVNTPTDQRLLFKSGDAVEIYLGTDLEKRKEFGQEQQEPRLGDTRLIIARNQDGKIFATRYRYVTEANEKPNTFSVETRSSGKDTLDDVVPLDDLSVRTALEEDGYVVECAIPWKELGVTPRSGLTLLGDVGVIYGNEGGTRNAIRYMWSDKSSIVSINNDLPSEVRIRPNQWGTWMLD